MSICRCGHPHKSDTHNEDAGCQVCHDGHDWEPAADIPPQEWPDPTWVA